MKLEHRVELELAIARRNYFRIIGDSEKASAMQKMVERALESFVLDRYPWGSEKRTSKGGKK